MKPRIIIDANIPYIRGTFDKVAEVEYLTAKEITPQKVKSADALIIRTRTLCNADLLEGSQVKFIATATIGTDHIDIDYCDAHNIAWTNAPGCNAESVAQWVGSVLAVWSNKHNCSLSGKTIGIVGHGHVGKRVERLARLLGMKVLLNDPPLAINNPEQYVDLQTISRQCDVITFHTPLTREGKFATYHLFNAQCITNGLEPWRKMHNAQLPNKLPRLIINAARGGIINENALLDTLHPAPYSLLLDFAIDCWEGEPETNPELREKALIATPHIAGYSADGKHNASQQVIKAVASFFNIHPDTVEGLPPKSTTTATGDTLKNQLLHNYNILADSDALKSEPHKFEHFRSNYPIRRELKIIHNS